MAPVDWGEIQNAKVDDLEEEQAERMYLGLAEVCSWHNFCLLF